MKILAISDTESKALWDYFDKSRLEGIDVILSCGDLDPRYLSFLATFFSGPVLYVHGNHDGCYEETPPEGCICIENQVFEYQGVRFAGFGGSMRYRPGPHQYTQMEMTMRVLCYWHRLRRRGGIDVLVTHAPAFGLGDGTSLTHTGFKVFLTVMEHLRPGYLVHGHIHLCYDPLLPRIRKYLDTTIINAYEKYVFEIP
jgi:Icc-related predicted phosphoesterase